MRETKQLHEVPKKTALLLCAPFASHPPTHSRIKSVSLNFQWQRNLYRGNVSHSLAGTSAPPQPRAAQGSSQISAEVCSLTLGSRSSWQLFCLREAVKFQIDGGCTAYD